MKMSTMLNAFSYMLAGFLTGIAVAGYIPFNWTFVIPVWMPHKMITLAFLFGVAGLLFFLVIYFVLELLSNRNLLDKSEIAVPGALLLLIVVLVVLPKEPEESLSEVSGSIDASDPLNIVLFTLDTTRADYIGCYQKTPIKTPCMDRLAREGVMFTRAYSTSNSTVPSHASIMTSLYVEEHNVLGNN
jgi:hypothetical protein